MGNTMKLILIVLLFLSAPAMANDDGASQTKCSSYEAIYKPHLEAGVSNKYRYRMQVEKIDGARAGDPFARFLLDTLSSDEGKLLSRLKLTFGCDGSGSMSCRAWYRREFHYDDKQEKLEPKTFNVVALNKDFTTHPRAVTEAGTGEFLNAPYALIFPALPQALAYTRDWERMQEDIEYFTPEKIPPSDVAEVWLFDRCNASTE